MCLCTVAPATNSRSAHSTIQLWSKVGFSGSSVWKIDLSCQDKSNQSWQDKSVFHMLEPENPTFLMSVPVEKPSLNYGLTERVHTRTYVHAWQYDLYGVCDVFVSSECSEHVCGRVATQITHTAVCCIIHTVQYSTCALCSIIPHCYTHSELLTVEWCT